MDDTPPEVQQLYQKMLMSKSPSERVKMACRMFDSARKIMIAAIIRDRPDITATQLRVEFFLRMYGDDFTAAEREKIVKWISDRQDDQS